jgi:hypothetical protein
LPIRLFLRSVSQRPGVNPFVARLHRFWGYGDVLAAREWRLLGPAAAMNGILLFGWSTAVIFHVLADTVRRARQ